MTTRNYWLNLFSGRTWQEFLDAGAEVSGFSEGRWSTLQQVQQGDYLLCYLTGVSRFIGILEVVSEPFHDDTPIWKDDKFPCRVRVRVVVHLEPDTAIPITHLKDQLSIFQNARSPRSWEGHVRGSPTRWKSSDGEAVVHALLEAKQAPISRPIDPAKFDRRRKPLKKPRVAETPSDQYETSQTVSMDVQPVLDSDNDVSFGDNSDKLKKNPTVHTEIQWLLLNLGSDMNYDVWVARNDRGREYNGQRFADIPRLKKDLFLRFDEKVNQTIELIDVLWLKGNSIQAAFEIESTTSIYSGLLRMSDLIAMQPNLSIPLYLVAPDERRSDVMREVTRPTFSRLSPPLNRVCKYIPFTELREHITKAGPYLRFMTTDFLGALSEEIEDRP
jgi:predicted RNA-binding protein